MLNRLNCFPNHSPHHRKELMMTKKIRFTCTLPDHLVARLADIHDHKGLTRNGLINHVLSEYAREYWATAPQPEDPQGRDQKKTSPFCTAVNGFDPVVALVELPQYGNRCSCGPGGGMACQREVGTQCRLHSHGGTPRGFQAVK
jgi:hypothetical protein